MFYKIKTLTTEHSRWTQKYLWDNTRIWHSNWKRSLCPYPKKKK